MSGNECGVWQGKIYSMLQVKATKLDAYNWILRSLCSSVTMVAKLRAGRPGFDTRQVKWTNIFLFATVSRPAQGPTQPPIKWLPRSLSPLHSFPSSSKVKNAWNYTSTAPYFFMSWYLSAGATLPYLAIRLIILTCNAMVAPHGSCL
jgi:hypothetical protein